MWPLFNFVLYKCFMLQHHSCLTPVLVHSYWISISWLYHAVVITWVNLSNEPYIVPASYTGLESPCTGSAIILHLIAEITYYPSHNRSANLRLWRKCHIKVPSYMNGSITSLTIQSHNYLLNDKDRERRGRNTVGTITAG